MSESDRLGPDENCSTCRFIRQGPNYFRCCRYPPIANPTQVGSAPGFPITTSDSWCGEWDRNPDSGRA